MKKSLLFLPAIAIAFFSGCASTSSYNNQDDKSTYKYDQITKNALQSSTYTIKRGDTLSGIAAGQVVPFKKYLECLQITNKISDTSKILVGQTLTLPSIMQCREELSRSIVSSIPSFGFPSRVQYQYNTISSLMDGNYNKITSVAQAKRNCNFGVGAGVGLGEVVALNGIYSIANPKGLASRMSPNAGLSYLTCSKFEPTQSFTVNDFTLSDIESEILQKYPYSPYMAISITGKFNNVQARSEDIDQPPYTNLIDWMGNHQNKFTLTNIKGTLIIMYLNPSIIGVGVPGFHSHFISSDFKTLGHVLDAKISQAKVQIQIIDKLFVIPTSKPLNSRALQAIETTSK